MELVQMAREMGKALQSDERYIKMNIARQACDADIDLQAQIEEFNLKKTLINLEVQKEDRAEDKIRSLNEEFRKLYAVILQNPNMAMYNESKIEFDAVFQEITEILNMSAQGQDPATCVYTPDACGGDCSGCSGCS